MSAGQHGIPCGPRIASGAAALALASCGQHRPLDHADSITEWVVTGTLGGCDLRYSVREVESGAPPADGWPSPDDVLAQLSSPIEIDVLWSADTIHPADDVDLQPQPWLAPLHAWRFEVSAHVQRRPVFAEDSTGECPDLLVVPLGVTASTLDGQLVIEDAGTRLGTRWRGSSFAPWTALEVSSVVFDGERMKVGLDVQAGEGDRFAWSEAVSMEVPAPPEGFTPGLLRVQVQGSLDSGTLALSSVSYSESGGALHLGLGSGRYDGR